MRELVHKGSTKDVYREGDHYIFHFSDRYSVFDWGEMPDHLNGKGAALAEFTKRVYEYLEKKGVPTHRLNLDSKRDEMKVRPFKVIRDRQLRRDEENVFIPLEVIFRLGASKGSSLLKRGYQEGARFETPMIEFTTKLERFDRPLTHEEAKELAQMNAAEWKNLLATTTAIAQELAALFTSFGITLWDGKVEFAMGEMVDGARKIVLVDSIGPDELRLTMNDIQLSKEVIRQHYRKLPWYQELDKAKAQYGEKFKEHIAPPAKLPAPFREAVEDMYLILPDLIRNVAGAKGRLADLMKRLKEQG